MLVPGGCDDGMKKRAWLRWGCGLPDSMSSLGSTQSLMKSSRRTPPCGSTRLAWVSLSYAHHNRCEEYLRLFSYRWETRERGEGREEEERRGRQRGEGRREGEVGRGKGRGEEGGGGGGGGGLPP